MKIIRVLAGLGLIALALPAAPVSAVVNEEIWQTGDDFAIAIHPPSIEFDLVPGTTTGETIRVRNTGYQETDLRIGVSPLTVTNIQYGKDYKLSTPRTEITRWTDIGLEEGCSAYKTGDDGSLYVHFRVKEECFVKFSTATPSNAPYGSQHMYVFFEEVRDTTDNSGLSMVRSIGVNIYGTNKTGGSGDADACGKIVNQKVPFWIFGGALDTRSTVENCGVLDFHAETSIEVRNLFGGIIYSDQESPADRIVMAETTREMKNSWQDTRIGVYKVKQTVKFLDEVHVVDKLAFIIPLWLIIVVVVCLLVIVLTIVYDRKKKLTSRRKK